MKHRLACGSSDVRMYSSTSCWFSHKAKQLSHLCVLVRSFFVCFPAFWHDEYYTQPGCSLITSFPATCPDNNTSTQGAGQPRPIHMFPPRIIPGRAAPAPAGGSVFSQVLNVWIRSKPESQGGRQRGREREGDWRPFRRCRERGIPLIRRWSGTMAALLSVPFALT